MGAYLAAKRSVDDRAIDRRVWDRFVDELDRRASETGGPLRILEVGAGVGSMITRLAERDAFTGRVRYRAIDLEPATITDGRSFLPGWIEAAGYEVSSTANGLVATRPDGSVELEMRLESADLFEVDAEVDAVVAAAVLDVVPLRAAIEHLSNLLVDDGLLYAPTTFDGGTSFAPTDPLDDRIEGLYHRHMDELREQPGGSRAGRRLLYTLPECGYETLAVGAGDWIVRPIDGEYPAEEEHFLASILETIDAAVGEYPASEISPERRERWIERRFQELDRGVLTFVAHNLDVLARSSSDG